MNTKHSDPATRALSRVQGMRAMSFRRFPIGTACALVSLLMATVAQAGPIVWTLQDVSFSDLGTASGTFTIDSATGDLLSWDVTTIQTTTGYTGFVYDSTLGTSTGDATADSIELYPQAPNAPSELVLTFENSLSTPGLDAIVTGSSSYETGSNCCQTFTRTVTSGDAAASTPEPSSEALLLAGMGLLGLIARRSRKTA